MIYLKLTKKPRTIKEVITNLLSYEVYLSLKSCITYHDEEFNKVECFENKYRSIDDIVTIVQTYFPKATEKQIISALFNTVIIKNNIEYYMKVFACNDIKKPTVCFKVKTRRSNFYNDDLNYFTFGNSKFDSIKQVCAIAGFNSAQELDNHFNKQQTK